MEFIVSIGVGYGEVLTGGVVALHKLAYELAFRGYKVTIFTEPVFPHKNINVEKNSDENNLNFDFDKENTVIIPSMDWVNKEGLPKVCRWALHHLNDNLVKNVEKTDKIYNYGTFNLNGLTESGKLTVFDYHEKLFLNENLSRNGKTCYILNKQTPKDYKKILKLFNAESLDDWKFRGGFKYLKDKFNEYEYFITFDEKSFYTLSAAMCGCKSIILQNNLTPQEYRDKNPIQKYGVAYGIQDIGWMENTIHKVEEHVYSLIEEDKKTIDKFVKDCELI